MKQVTMTLKQFMVSQKNTMKSTLEVLLDRHAQSRAKISSQCDTLIGKKLVEDMIKELDE